MKAATLTAPIEGNASARPFPSIATLLGALVLDGFACFGWLHMEDSWGMTVTMLSIFVIACLFIPPGKRPPGQDLRSIPFRGWLREGLIALLVVFVIVLVANLKVAPQLEQAFHHLILSPIFVAALWLFLCAATIRRWRILRRTPRTGCGSA